MGKESTEENPADSAASKPGQYMAAPEEPAGCCRYVSLHLEKTGLN